MQAWQQDGSGREPDAAGAPVPEAAGERADLPDGTISHDGVRGDRSLWPTEAADVPFAYLTTTGRTSGRPHRIEMWFALDGQRVLLMSGGRDRSDWVKNLREDPQVSIEIAGVTRSGRAAVVLPESPDDALARRLLVEKYQRRDELADWGRNSLPVVIDVD